MRGLLVCAAVAAVAAPVLAGVSEHTGVIEITTPGAVLTPGGGCNGEDAYVIDCSELIAANQDGTFYVDIYVSTTDSAMTAFQITLAGADGLQLNAASTMMGNVLNYAGAYAGYAARGGGFANLGWDMANGIAWSAQAMPMAGPATEQVGTIAVAASNGWAAWAELQTAGLDCEQCTCITARDEVLADIGIGDSQYNGLLNENITVIPLCITPEPATALLLLVGLPLLRRRR